MYRSLGQTGLRISPIGFGAFKIGRNQGIKYPHAYDLPSDAEVDRLLNGVLDLGINLIDTAPAYGTSEERIGRSIAHRRGQFILSTKVGETFENGTSTFGFSKPALIDSIHRSLRRLRADFLDLVFIHSDGRDIEILNQTDVVAALQALKDQGLVRFIGLSGKTPQGAAAAMKWADAIMVEYHPQDTSHQQVIVDAIARGVGVLVKKPLASGKLPPQTALPFVLANPGVGAAVIGGLNLEHIRQNFEAALGQSLPMPPDASWAVDAGG